MSLAAAEGGPLSNARLAGLTKALSQACTFFNGIAKASIKRDDRSVCGTNLKVYLGASELRQAFFGRNHESASDTSPPMCRMDCQMMDPTSHPIKTSQNGCDKATVSISNEKKLRLYSELSPNYSRRFIP
jgi:hypothetical protein